MSGWNLNKGQNHVIDAHDVPDDMVLALVRAARSRKAIPYVQVNHGRLVREMFLGATEEQFKTASRLELHRMKQMDAYIALRGSQNIFELSDVPTSKMKMALSLMKPVRS